MAFVGFPSPLRCVAKTTGTEFQGHVPKQRQGRRAHPVPPAPVSNYLKSAEWTPDGSCIVTNSADNHLRTFIVPPELLDERDAPLKVGAFSILPSSEPVYATAICPLFSLYDQRTSLLLSSVREHPIRLTSALHPTGYATYSHINPTTEAFITPHSILYPLQYGGTHFLTGSESLIALFDINRPGKDGPITSFPTIPSKRKKKLVGGGVGMSGIVSTMALSPTGDGILAAGTFTRHVGLYAANGTGDLLGTWKISDTPADRHIGGSGITQVLWSPCGRYLLVVERRSRGILIYDIRQGQFLGWLEGRKAMTHQRMNVSIMPATETTPWEVWAGGTEGEVMVWSSPEMSVGGKKPDRTTKLHDDPISSAAIHPFGPILATSSGQKYFPPDPALGEDTSAAEPPKMDNSLRLWHIP